MTTLTDLLAPLPGSSPCGEDMSFSHEFDAIAEARRFDDASLDQGDWVTDIKEADWRFVVAECERLLASRCKDLRLASWLCEAWSKTRGFAGLSEGYSLMAQLVERYWEQLHPLVEDGDLEERIGSLTWLLVRSQSLLRELPLTRSPRGAYGALDHESARALALAIERNPGDASELASGKLTLAEFEAARRETPRAFYTQTLEALAGCKAMLGLLEQAIDARLGMEGPSFSPLKEALQSVTDLATRFARDAGAVSAAPAPTSAPAADAMPNNNPDTIAPSPHLSGIPVMSGPIQNRAQALAQLREVAEFFRRTEPHSPVAYLADKAAHWGEMPLHDWLRAVVKEQGTLAHIEELLGVEHNSHKE